MKQLKEGSKIFRNVILEPDELEFYKLLSNGSTIENASEVMGSSKRTYEERMNKTRNALDIRNNVQFIAELIRNKIID